MVFMLCSGLCPDASAQTRAVQKEAATQTMKLQAKPVSTAELNRFCDAGSTTSSKRGGVTTYSCQSKPAGSATSIQARPQVQRSDINCDYSEQGGAITWLGCTCTANDEGNCNNFITNCVEKGDDVGGNSGGATCSPPGD
jgi:hypothetical protein